MLLCAVQKMSTDRADRQPGQADVALVAGPGLGVEVAYGAPGALVELVHLRVAVGTTLAQAVLASGLLQRHALDLQALQLGIWGRLKEPGTVLRERDRIEIYRPLLVDPKEARRQRYGKHKLALEARKAKAAAAA